MMLGNHRREKYFEAFMCIIFPLLFMALRMFYSDIHQRRCNDILLPDYIVQGHRFNIIETIGCVPTYYLSIPSIFIISIPPLALSLLGLIYGGQSPTHTLTSYLTRRLQYSSSSILSATKSQSKPVCTTPPHPSVYRVSSVFLPSPPLQSFGLP